jgi:hypothetical protein
VKSASEAVYQNMLSEVSGSNPLLAGQIDAWYRTNSDLFMKAKVSAFEFEIQKLKVALEFTNAVLKDFSVHSTKQKTEELRDTKDSGKLTLCSANKKFKLLGLTWSLDEDVIALETAIDKSEAWTVIWGLEQILAHPSTLDVAKGITSRIKVTQIYDAFLAEKTSPVNQTGLVTEDLLLRIIAVVDMNKKDSKVQPKLPPQAPAAGGSPSAHSSSSEGDSKGKKRKVDVQGA